MRITRLADAKPYASPKHIDLVSLRLQGLEATPSGFCSLGLSHYLPGGEGRNERRAPGKDLCRD